MNRLITDMLAQADPSQVAGLSRFFKTGPGQYGEGDKFLGIKVPVTREVVKNAWRELDFTDLDECLRSEFHEIRLAGLLALIQIFSHARKGSVSFSSARKGPVSLSLARKVASSDSLSARLSSGLPLQQQCVDFYLAHTATINNWDLVDLSCYPLLGEWLLDKDRNLLYELARNGKTIWEQRIGMVSTMTFVRHGQLADTFAIADILLHHPHDLIQKAVGWLLREAGKRDESALLAFLEPRAATMPRTALRYALEKLDEPLRKEFLGKRVQ